MKYKLSAIQLSRSLAITFKNKKRGLFETITFTDTHLNYEKAVAYLDEVTQLPLFQERQKVEEEVLAEFKALKDTSKLLSKWSNGALEITSSSVLYDGQEVQSEMTEFLIEKFLNDPHDQDGFNAWSNFIKVVSNATSYKVVNRLFMFLQKNDLTITADGKVLAWKVVRPDYKDKHSGRFDNSPGQVLEMPRGKVDDDDTSHCSYGFHICSWGYLRSFSSTGDKVVQVEVDVNDIVAIPLDYNGEKVRVCKYRVVQDAGVWGEDVDASRLPKIAGHSANV
jgi:hypothetical protein